MTDQPDQHPSPQALVLDAFRIAARQGRPEWHRMAGAVLKNRLLDLTERSFDEAAYGADRFVDLVEQLDDLLTVDHSAKPFVIELQEPYRSEIEQADAVSASSSGKTIRSDLWHAVVDYSHGQRWVLDRVTGKAIRVREGDDSGGGVDLPTLDRATLQTWRIDFIEECSATVSDAEALQLKAWVGEGLGTAALPKRLRGPWTIRMRDRVHERLLEFFRSQELDPPKDLLVLPRQRKPANELRSFIVRCISLMNDRELKELQIPAEVAMRAHG